MPTDQNIIIFSCAVLEIAKKRKIVSVSSTVPIPMPIGQRHATNVLRSLRSKVVTLKVAHSVLHETIGSNIYLKQSSDRYFHEYLS